MILSPSSCARRAACPGSSKLERELNIKQIDSEAALEGTRAHAFAARGLKDNDLNMNEMDPEMWQGVNRYIVHVESIILDKRDKKDTLFRIEMPVVAPSIHEAVQGTPDCVFIHKNKKQVDIHIWDFKYGHMPVEAVDNLQLLEYAAGVIDTYEFLTGRDYSKIQFHFYIIQPRDYSDRTLKEWHLGGIGFEKILLPQLQKIESAATSEDAQFNLNDNCKYCPVNIHCPKIQDIIYLINDNLNQTETLPENIGPDLKELMTMQKALDAKIMGLSELAFNLLKMGKTVQGFMIGNGRSSTRWKDSMTLDLFKKVEEDIGIKLLKDPEPITPLQAIKAGWNEQQVKVWSETTPGKARLEELDMSKISKIFKK